MKTFKTLLLVALLIICSISHHSVSYASIIQEEVVSPADDAVQSQVLDAYVRNCKFLNIRTSPSVNSDVIATIPQNKHVLVVGQVGKWFKILYDNKIGYVHWKYIKFTESDIREDSKLIGDSIIHYVSSDNRDNNISIACNTINGIILKPGEKFKWSEVVGQTTSQKGYLEAPIIVNKKPTTGFGGGVCQVSTTLYNALLDTNIVPDKVYSHSIGCQYAEKDATVAYGSKDFIFTNSYDYPIQINAYSYKSIVMVDITKVEE